MRWVIMLAAALVVACGAALPAASPTSSTRSGSWRSAEAPTGAQPGSEWVSIESYDGTPILAAVLRPPGTGPWPVALFLHGSDGMQPKHLEVASWLASEGFLTLAPCWTRGTLKTENLGCVSRARRWNGLAADDLVKDVFVLITAAQTLPDVRKDGLVLVGHSLGAWAALYAVSSGGRANAVVSISGTYSGENKTLGDLGVAVGERLDQMSAPLLIVHGAKDEVWSMAVAQQYEELALERGKNVEAIYVADSPHDLPYIPEYWADGTRAKLIAFLKKQL